MGLLRKTNTKTIKITKTVFFDLGCWLSKSHQYSEQQLKRLQDESHYLALIDLASIYWLIGALYSQLNNKGVLALLPAQLAEYLTEINHVYLQRSLAIQQEVYHCCELLQRENINVIVIKGAASLFNGVAEPISRRFMNDIDLLVPENLLQQARCVLKSAGYRENIKPFEEVVVHHHHAPELIRENSQCYIELHRWPVKKLFDAILPTEDAWQASVKLNVFDNINVLQLSPSHQVILTITHSELSNKGFKDQHIDLHQLFSLHEICQHFSNEIDWSLVEHHFKRVDKYYLLQSTLHSMKKLFGLAFPIPRGEHKLCQTHFDKCLERFVYSQGHGNFFTELKRIMYAYHSDTIYTVYGGEKGLGLWRGRIRAFSRHVQVLLQKCRNKYK